MFSIFRGVRVISWWNGVFTPDLTVLSVSSQLAASLLFQHFLGSLNSFLLCVMHSRRSLSIIPLVHPLPIISLENRTILLFTHDAKPNE